MELKTTKTSEQTKQRRNRVIDIEDKLMGAREEWRWGWTKKVKGNKRDKLPIVK